jgi:hypothetical protein
MSDAPGVGSHQQPTLPLVQIRQQRLELHGEHALGVFRQIHSTFNDTDAGIR